MKYKVTKQQLRADIEVLRKELGDLRISNVNAEERARIAGEEKYAILAVLAKILRDNKYGPDPLDILGNRNAR